MDTICLEIAFPLHFKSSKKMTWSVYIIGEKRNEISKLDCDHAIKVGEKVVLNNS